MEVQNSDNTIVCTSMESIYDLYDNQLLKHRYVHCAFRTTNKSYEYIQLLVKAGGGLGASFTYDSSGTWGIC